MARELSLIQKRTRDADKEASMRLRRDMMTQDTSNIREKGAQARQTAMQSLRFNRDYQTAGQRGNTRSFRERTDMMERGDRLGFQARMYGSDVTREGQRLGFQSQMYGSDVNRERNLMGYDTEQRKSSLARDKFGWNRQREAAKFNQQREMDDRFEYYDEKTGQTVMGRWSDNANPGKELQSRLAGAKDKEAEFAKFTPSEMDIFRKYDNFMQGQLDPKTTSYQNEMADRRVDTSGWSATRLKRSMGENINRGAGQRYLDRLYDMEGQGGRGREYQGSRGYRDYQGMAPYVSVSDTGGERDSQQVRDTISALTIQDRTRRTPSLIKESVKTKAPVKRKPAITSIPSQPRVTMSPDAGYRQSMFGGPTKLPAKQITRRDEGPMDYIRRQASRAATALNLNATNRGGVTPQPSSNRQRYSDTIRRTDRGNITTRRALRGLGM